MSNLVTDSSCDDALTHLHCYTGLAIHNFDLSGPCLTTCYMFWVKQLDSPPCKCWFCLLCATQLWYFASTGHSSSEERQRLRGFCSRGNRLFLSLSLFLQIVSSFFLIIDSSSSKSSVKTPACRLLWACRPLCGCGLLTVFSLCLVLTVLSLSLHEATPALQSGGHAGHSQENL